jgi:hypothetical protein
LGDGMCEFIPQASTRALKIVPQAVGFLSTPLTAATKYATTSSNKMNPNVNVDGGKQNKSKKSKKQNKSKKSKKQNKSKKSKKQNKSKK